MRNRPSVEFLVFKIKPSKVEGVEGALISLNKKKKKKEGRKRGKP